MINPLSLLSRALGLPWRAGPADLPASPLSPEAISAMTPREAAALLERLAQAAARPAVELRAVTARSNMALDGSRLGGCPALPDGSTWPGTDGRAMIFVIQINLAEMPPTDILPRDGLLQVFVGDDIDYGCLFPSRSTYAFPDFLIRHIPAGTDLKMGELPTHQNSPFISTDAIALSGSSSLRPAEPSAPYDWGLPVAPLEELIALSDAGPARRAVPQASAWLGGHARFIQSDIRDQDPSLRDMRVLLVLESASPLRWGDHGAAVFFGDPEKTSRGDFSETAWSWDCH